MRPLRSPRVPLVLRRHADLAGEGRPGRATDPPPPGEVSASLVPEEPAPEAGADGSDLLRADEAGTEDESEAPWDSMPQSFGMD